MKQDAVTFVRTGIADTAGFLVSPLVSAERLACLNEAIRQQQCSLLPMWEASLRKAKDEYLECREAFLEGLAERPGQSIDMRKLGGLFLIWGAGLGSGVLVAIYEFVSRLSNKLKDPMHACLW